jgi:multiple sugar transport system substrate-binding protein
MLTSHLSRRRFLQASSAALAAIAAGVDVSTLSEAANAELTWLVRNGPQENTWEQKVAIPQFQKAHPGVKVNLVSVPGPTTFDVKLANLIAAGTPPDVWSQWGPSDFVDYSWRGLTANLDAYLKRDIKEYADFYPGAMKYGQWNHTQHGIPLMLGGTYTFFHMDLFDKAGVPYPPVSWDDKSWTWDEMIRRAKKLTKHFGDPSKAIYGVYLILGCPEEFVWLWGGDVWDKDVYYGNGVPHTSHWNTPQAIDAIQSLADLTYVHKVMPNPAVTNVLSSSGNNDPFLTGRVAMSMTGIWGFWQFKDLPFRWGAAALPWVHSNKDGVYADPWLLGARSKYPEAAWQFIKYLTTTNGARQYMHATNTPVPHTTLLQEWFRQFKHQTPEQVKTVFDGSLRHGYLSIQNDLVAYDKIRNIITQELSPVMAGNAKAKDVMPGLDRKLARLFRRLRP